MLTRVILVIAYVNDLRLKGEFRGLLATNLIGPSPKFRAILNGATKLTPNAPKQLKVSAIHIMYLPCPILDSQARVIFAWV